MKNGGGNLMRTHFLSVLGTTLYEPAVYDFQGDSGATEQEFVQIALMERFAGQLKDGGKITILLTDGAREKNWENRVYTGDDMKLSGRFSPKSIRCAKMSLKLA